MPLVSSMAARMDATQSAWLLRIRMGKMFLEKLQRPVHETQHMSILMSSEGCDIALSLVMPETGSLEGEFLGGKGLRSKVLDAEIGDDEKESSVSILAMMMGGESHVATKRQNRDKAGEREGDGDY
jgi:hypothetical protein